MFIKFVVIKGDKKDETSFKNDILAMLSPEGEKVGLGKVMIFNIHPDFSLDVYCLVQKDEIKITLTHYFRVY